MKSFLLSLILPICALGQSLPLPGPINVPGQGGGGGGGGGSGTVTSVTFTGDGTVLSSTPSSAVTTSGTVTATLNTAAANTILGNDTGSTAAPAYSSVSAYLDNAFGSAQGDILYRGSSGWTVLTPGSSGQVLATQGASANPHYITVSGGTSGNPTASIGLAAVNGVASTYMTSDSAPALSQAIVPTWTGLHTFSVTDTSSSGNTHYGAEIAATINQTSTAGFTDLYINRTQTAAGSGTQYLINAAVGGTSKFSVSNAGAVAAVGNITGYTFAAAAAATIGFSSGTQLYEPSSTNGILEIANYANTSLTRIDLGGTTSSFVALQPSGTTLTIGTADGGTSAGSLTVSGILTGKGPIVSQGYTVGTLPTGTTGAIVYVTDSTQTMTAAIGSTLTGGGSYTIPVFYDGAAWRGL